MVEPSSRYSDALVALTRIAQHESMPGIAAEYDRLREDARDGRLAPAQLRHAAQLAARLRATIRLERRVLELPPSARDLVLARFGVLAKRIQCELDEALTAFRDGVETDRDAVETAISSLDDSDAATLHAAITAGDVATFRDLFEDHVATLGRQWEMEVERLVRTRATERVHRLLRRVAELSRWLVGFALDTGSSNDPPTDEAVDGFKPPFPVARSEQLKLDTVYCTELPHVAKNVRTRYLRLTHGEARERLRSRLRHGATEAFSALSASVEMRTVTELSEIQSSVHTALQSAVDRDASSALRRTDELIRFEEVIASVAPAFVE